MGMKDELYPVLNDFGKENIQMEFQKNINLSIKNIIIRDIEKNLEILILYQRTYPT
jgi:hypothetical protein